LQHDASTEIPEESAGLGAIVSDSTIPAPCPDSVEAVDSGSGVNTPYPTSPWTGVRHRLRERGLRWTPQRRLLIEILADADGHVTGAELIERCRRVDPQTIPSTVYWTLDVLEELGYVRHAHAAGGREEFHVLPADIHGHMYCSRCGGTWELCANDARALIDALAANRGFSVDLSHLTVSGVCAGCADDPAPVPDDDGSIGSGAGA
jgi:Fur family transcriptional regulator, ferric uptake regulator